MSNKTTINVDTDEEALAVVNEMNARNRTVATTLVTCAGIVTVTAVTAMGLIVWKALKS